jgi:ParB family chromosome partitioning protein
MRVPLADVCANPLNKRPTGLDEQSQEMAETIRAHGVIQPLVVSSASAYLAAFPRQRRAVGAAAWVALIGNRRLHAAALAGLDEVPILVNDDQVTSMYEVMLVENGHRRDLPPTLEAEAMAEALRAAGSSQAELARRIGKSAMYVSQRLALLELLPEFRAMLDAGQLTVETARTLGALSKEEQRALLQAGPPYRRKPARRAEALRPVTIRVSSPAVAAESIRAKFSDAELAELVALLSSHLNGSAT